MKARTKDYTVFIESDGTHERVYEVLIIERDATSSFRSLKKMVEAVANVGEASARAANAIANAMADLARQTKS